VFFVNDTTTDCCFNPLSCGWGVFFTSGETGEVLVLQKLQGVIFTSGETGEVLVLQKLQGVFFTPLHLQRCLFSGKIHL
jgi:hypothetical protein